MRHSHTAAFFRPSPSHPANTLPLSNESWEGLVQQACDEFMLPALAHQVRSLGLTAGVPDEILSCLTGAEALNAERNRLFISEAVHAAKLLNRIGIQPVALKGLAYLVAGVYPNIGARYLADIDFLVPASELPRAVAQLRDHGYREDRSDLLGRLRHHYPGVARPGLPQIEIHDAVGLGVCRRLLPASEMLEDAKPVTLAGARLLIPSPTHLVSHLVLHSQIVHPYCQRIFPPIRAQHDLALLQAQFGRYIDWIAIERAYSRAGEASTLALHLLQAQQDIGFQIPESLLNSASGLANRIRWQRRALLNRYPWIRYVDPAYVLMTLLSRRFRLLPRILSQPGSWVTLLRRLTRVQFYRNLFSDFR